MVDLVHEYERALWEEPEHDGGKHQYQGQSQPTKEDLVSRQGPFEPVDDSAASPPPPSAVSEQQRTLPAPIDQGKLLDIDIDAEEADVEIDCCVSMEIDDTEEEDEDNTTTISSEPMDSAIASFTSKSCPRPRLSPHKNSTPTISPADLKITKKINIESTTPRGALATDTGVVIVSHLPQEAVASGSQIELDQINPSEIIELTQEACHITSGSNNQIVAKPVNCPDHALIRSSGEAAGLFGLGGVAERVKMVPRNITPHDRMRRFKLARQRLKKIQGNKLTKITKPTTSNNNISSRSLPLPATTRVSEDQQGVQRRLSGELQANVPAVLPVCASCTTCSTT